MTKPCPVAVLCSDLHLDEYTWRDRPSLCGDSKHAFQQVVDFACKKNLPIIAAGDLIDTKRNVAGPIGFLRRCMDQLEDADCGFYYIQGQHELQGSPWLGEIHRWPTWLHGRREDICGVQVGGIDWTPRDQVAERLEAIPGDLNLLVMHQLVHEFIGGITTAELHLDQVPHVDLLLVGDYHQYRHEKATGKFGHEYEVLSIGATHMRSISEIPPHRFAVLFDDMSYKTVKLKNRPHMEEQLLMEESVDLFVEQIGGLLDCLIESSADKGVHADLLKPTLRVKYHVEIENAYGRIAQAVGDKAHLFTKELLPSRDEEVREADVAEDEISALGLAGCLPLACDEDEHPEVFTLCHRLLTSDAPLDVLATSREEFLEREKTG